MTVIIQGELAERICWLAHRMNCTPVEAIKQAVIDEETLIETLAEAGSSIEPNAEAKQ